MPRRQRRSRAIFVFLLVVTTMSMFVTLLLWRAHRTDLTAKRLCQVISQIIVDQDSRLAGVSYYKHHPAELARAHRDNHRILERLNCSSLPPVRPPGGHP